PRPAGPLRMTRIFVGSVAESDLGEVVRPNGGNGSLLASLEEYLIGRHLRMRWNACRNRVARLQARGGNGEIEGLVRELRRVELGKPPLGDEASAAAVRQVVLVRHFDPAAGLKVGVDGHRNLRAWGTRLRDVVRGTRVVGVILG